MLAPKKEKRMRVKTVASYVILSVLVAGCAPNGATPTPKDIVVVAQLDSGEELIYVGQIRPRMDLSTFSADVELREIGDPSDICRSEGDFAMTEPNVGTGIIVCPSHGIRLAIRTSPYPVDNGFDGGTLTDESGSAIGTYKVGWGDPAEAL